MNLNNLQKFLSLFLLFFVSLELNAELLKAGSAGDLAKNVNSANINALLIFTSQDGLNSGLFHFTKVGVDMQIYNLPFSYQFESDTPFNYFLVGNIGYSQVFVSQNVVLPENSSLNYENHLRTYTAGLGGGIRYKPIKELGFWFGGELIYSRSGASLKKADDGTGTVVTDFFNSNYNDNFTYKVFGKSVYKPEIDFLNPYMKLDYKFFDTKSDLSVKQLSSFSSQSSIFSLSVGLETDELYQCEWGSLTLEGYLHASYLSGNIVESIKFDKYAKVGGVTYWYLEDKELWIKRFFLEVSSINADGLEGYNIGLGFTLNY